MMIKNKLHLDYCKQNSKIADWYCENTKGYEFPVYSSYDIRDAGFKISNVDANIFPAGFNNICPTDKDSAVDIMGEFIRKHYGNVKKILLVTEEHTNNPYYWENVITIQSLLEKSGYQTLIGVPRKLNEPMQVTSATGKNIKVVSAFEDSAEVKDFSPDLIISNNDFSEAHEEWALHTKTPINPPRELGWYQRKKSRYFKIYNSLVEDFSKVVGFDPFLLNVKTEIFENFDLSVESSQKLLAERVDIMIASLKKEYELRNIKQEPFVFVKNNSGTYGLAVIRVGSGKEIFDWNYKSRKKMKAAKGGRDVEELIIQEGIPSRVQAEGATAEPVIYMIGCELAGGFLRTHGEKNETESLNSPGAVYKRLCVSDLNISLDKAPLENVYGWSARLGLLAIAREAREMGVEFKKYSEKSCS